MARAAHTALLALVVVLLAAGPAAASSVSSVRDKYLGGFFLGGSGASDDLVVADAGDGQTVRVHDRRGRLEAGIGCTPIDPSTALCRPQEPLQVTLGDGDDRFSASGLTHVTVGVYAGAGDDLVRGSPGPDALTGNIGSDRLLGGGGGDFLEGDSPFPVPGEPDVLDGGAGSDAISYVGRRRRLLVDLSSPDTPAGAAGDRDVLRSIERAFGGYGADRLVGDDGPNRLIGYGGPDQILGRGGADILDGRGVLSGGRGDDLLRSLGGTVRCGPGEDRVDPSQTSFHSHRGLEPKTPPWIGRDCEALVVSHPPFTAARPLRLGLRRFDLRCPQGCIGSLRTRGRAERFSLRRGARARLQPVRRRVLVRLVVRSPSLHELSVAFRLR